MNLQLAAERLAEKTWTWSDVVGTGDHVRVPQGSHLGDTLITLDDTYEDSAVDCLLVQAAPAVARALLATQAQLQQALALIRGWAQPTPPADPALGTLGMGMESMRNAVRQQASDWLATLPADGEGDASHGDVPAL